MFEDLSLRRDSLTLTCIPTTRCLQTVSATQAFLRESQHTFLDLTVLGGPPSVLTSATSCGSRAFPCTDDGSFPKNLNRFAATWTCSETHHLSTSLFRS